MRSQSRLKIALLAMVGGSLMLSGCARVRGHQGYIVDSVLMKAVQPGIDNRQSVEASLGRPTFTGQFDKNTWYYVSRETHQFAFNSPSPKTQQVTRISFDNSGNVTAVDNTGVELVANISPDGDKTPTLGRDRTFFEELFGNIGAIGAPGGGSQGRDPTRP